MILSHRIILDPTEKQRQYFAKAAGCARFVWNWAIEAWNTEYAAGGKPNAYELKRRFNAIKYTQYPWLKEIHRDAHAQPFENLRKAWVRFFKKTAGKPVFHKKGRKDSFYVANDQVTVQSGQSRVRLPIIGWIRMREELRFDGKIMSATIKREANRWFISIQVDVGDYKKQRVSNGSAGLDIGLKAAATIVDDNGARSIEASRPLKKALENLRRCNHKLSRRKRGGKRWKRTKARIGRIHARAANIRQDFWHKITTQLCRENQAIGIETLNTAGMLKNHCLARAISDVGFYEPKRQLIYKAQIYGVKIVAADQWFPSSKTCSSCGCVKEKLLLSERTFLCGDCGHVQDRDANAATNLRKLTEMYPRLEGNQRSGSGRALSSHVELRTGPCLATNTN